MQISFFHTFHNLRVDQRSVQAITGPGEIDHDLCDKNKIICSLIA